MTNRPSTFKYPEISLRAKEPYQIIIILGLKLFISSHFPNQNIHSTLSSGSPWFGAIAFSRLFLPISTDSALRHSLVFLFRISVLSGRIRSPSFVMGFRTIKRSIKSIIGLISSTLLSLVVWLRTIERFSPTLFRVVVFSSCPVGRGTRRIDYIRHQRHDRSVIRYGVTIETLYFCTEIEELSIYIENRVQHNWLAARSGESSVNRI